jgi:molybdopterin-containing oxidoreductase family iron-sulfur binding subunit
MNETYWRSLGELENSASFRENLEREFPEGASELPEGVTRREMLQLLGASLSLAGLAACRRPVEKIVPYVNAPEEIVPGIPRHYATTMPFGRSAYGLVVESHEGRPTKIEGNELHPSTSGRSSVRAQAAILGLYDPDRAQRVRHDGKDATWADFVTAWGELEKKHLEDGGASLALLTPSFASPTRHRMLELFRARFPKARIAVHEPVSDETALALHAGKPAQPVYHLDKAAVILSIDADILGNDPEDVRHIAAFAAGRRAAIDGGAMNRLWSVEAAHSLTGAMADHRLPLPARLLPAFAVLLTETLSQGGSSSNRIEGIDGKWLGALSRDLAQNRGRSLIVAGPGLPESVHSFVKGMNEQLGNIGTTVTYHEAVDAAVPSRASMVELTAAMKAGSVATLLIVGGNPVYDAPGDLEFAAAIKKVATTVSLSTHVDETGSLASWLIPAAHFLESWDDARAVDGTMSVVQPLILPLFGGKGATELMGLVATGKDQPGHDLVRETWKPILGEANFDRSWNRVLHDGVLKGSATPPVDAYWNPDTHRVVADMNAGFQVQFVPSPYLHDGRYANDGWLQELPDRITKLTWDNPALLSPGTARSLGVAEGDLVMVSVRGRSLTLPAAIVPGQADETIVLTLGYGRSAAGRIANGVGANAYLLRSSEALHFDKAAVGMTAGTALLAATQEHGSMEGRALIREATLDEYKREPAFAQEAVEIPKLESLWTEKPYNAGHQWGMTIDLNSCVGCNACVVACQSENNVPIVGKDQVRRGREMHWIRVDRYFTGKPEQPRMIFQPVPCMQCENAPCEQVCPVAATVHDDEGLNVMAYNRCIGTRYCSNNCPYKVRRFNFFNYTKDTPEILKLVQNPDVTVRSRGVMEKCTYCTQRINAGKLDAKIAGREVHDGDIKTACQQACPAGAIEFGDLRDPGSRVAAAKKDPRNYALLAELNTKPRTTYLARVRNPHPDLEAS